MKHILLPLAAVFLWCGPALAGVFAVTGGKPPIDKAVVPVIEQFKSATGHLATIVNAGPKKGLEDLLAGKADVLVVIKNREQMIDFAKKEGIALNISDLVFTEITKDRIFLAVNPANTVDKLSADQVNGIFAGSITNWKDVGGTNKEIIVVWSNTLAGVNTLVKERYNITKVTDVMEMRNGEGVVSAIAANPEAIGIVGEGSMNPTIKGLTPPVEAMVYFVTRGTPSSDVVRLIELSKKHFTK